MTYNRLHGSISLESTCICTLLSAIDNRAIYKVISDFASSMYSFVNVGDPGTKTPLISYENLRMGNNTTFPSTTPFLYNEPFWATFDFFPRHTGRHYHVFRGKAYSHRGFFSRANVVIKFLRTIVKPLAEDVDYEMAAYLSRTRMAKEMAAEFSNLGGVKKDFWVEFAAAATAYKDNVSILSVAKRSENEMIIIEEEIGKDLCMFVSEKGQINLSLQHYLDTFCHYSYQKSNGRYLICKLVGHEHRGMYSLICPCIHSTEKEFGLTDNGENGIEEFFTFHKCNELCEKLNLKRR